MSPKTRPAVRYCDYYGMLSYKDFLAHEASGTLSTYTISARTDQGETT